MMIVTINRYWLVTLITDGDHGDSYNKQILTCYITDGDSYNKQILTCYITDDDSYNKQILTCNIYYWWW
jgi:hypothetical protein